jgi:hypothetical protein
MRYNRTGLADKASVILDRLTKMNNNATKARTMQIGCGIFGGRRGRRRRAEELGREPARKIITDAAQGIMKANG